MIEERIPTYLKRFEEALQSGRIKKLDFIFPKQLVKEEFGISAKEFKEYGELMKAYHDEVIFYFGRLYEFLDFEELHFTGRYPDAMALLDGKKVGIEFEVLSGDFKHRDVSKCDIIVCWRKNKDIYDGDRKLEILELEPFMKVLLRFMAEQEEETSNV